MESPTPTPTPCPCHFSFSGKHLRRWCCAEPWRDRNALEISAVLPGVQPVEEEPGYRGHRGRSQGVTIAVIWAARGNAKHRLGLEGGQGSRKSSAEGPGGVA